MDSGASDAFFPEDRHALVGEYVEVSCSRWNGWDGDALWDGACMDGESASFWPDTSGGCANKGMNLTPCPLSEKYSSYILGSSP